MLSPAELQHYRDAGYVLVRGLFDAERLARWQRRFEDLIEGRVEPPAGLLVVRDVMVAKKAVVPRTPLHAVNKIFGLEDEPVLYEYSRDAKLLDVVGELIGRSIMSITANLLNKPPGVDGRHPFHQDLLYFGLRPADRIVGAWSALQATRRENGCLAVIPGSHTELRKHADPDWEWVNAYFHGAEGAETAARVWVEMEPGDTLLFHPLLLHGSGRNRTDDFRRAIVTHYAATTCERVENAASAARHFRELR